MRIINRHYSDLLPGYNAVLEYHQRFEETWPKERTRLEREHARKMTEYRQQFAAWQQEVQLVDDRYRRAYDAWLISERPGRERYERDLVIWRRRLDAAIRRAESEAQKARSRFDGWQALFWFSMILCVVLAIVFYVLFYPLVVLPIFAAIFAYLRFDAERQRVKKLTFRRNLIHATTEPAYHPMTPEPKRGVYPVEPSVPPPLSLPTFNTILNTWWSYIASAPQGVYNEERVTEGTEGEVRLMAELARVLSDDFLAIANAKLRSKLDGDIVVLGQNGIWVLDSKYYAGSVVYDEQGWYHEKKIYTKGGGGVQEVIPLTMKNISAEWESERDSVVTTLQKHMRSPYPPVVGGIAFTYDGARLDISDDCPVTTGTAQDWSRQIASVPAIPGFTERDLVECAHHILNFSHRMEKDHTGSAIDLANTIRNDYYNELRKLRA